MNIVHIYDGHESIHEGQGSLPRIVWNVARRTAARGHDVTIVERQWEGLDPVTAHEGVTFRRLRIGTGSDKPWEEIPYELVESPSGIAKLLLDRTNFGWKALRTLKTIEFNAVHTYLPFAANVLATVAPWLRSRMVYTAQLGELRLDALTESADDSVPNSPEILHWFSPDVYLARRTAYTTVLNPNVKQIFEQNGVPNHKLVHIPNGVDTKKFCNIDRQECERVRSKFDLGDRPVVFFAGTIMPRKGVAELVQAAGDVIEAGHDDVRFVLAGETRLDDAYFQRVKSIIEDQGIEKNVVFTGYLNDSDLFPLYKTADVFVLPSFEEGFGMVVSEAMAAGTPPVASRINGVIQQVEDGTSGILVESGVSDQFARAINRLLDDPKERRSMSKQSRERARLFGWEHIVNEYVKVYSSIQQKHE